MDGLVFRIKLTRAEWEGRIPQWIAMHLPHRLVYFCAIRAYSDAWAASGSKTPDELTFEEVVGPWWNGKR